jgi:hypothetical protein
MQLFPFFFSFFTIPVSPSKECFISNSKYVFKHIANDHFRILRNHSFKQAPLPFEFQTKCVLSKNVVMENLIMQNDDFHKVRLSFFSSDDKQMFQSVWYPKTTTQAPLLSIDLVYYSDKMTICFVNLIETVKDNIVSKSFSGMKDRNPLYSEELSRQLMPIKHYVNDAFLYRHIYDISLLETTLPRIIEEYIHVYIDVCKKYEVNKTHTNQKKQTEYNRLRKLFDANFVLKSYFHPNWYKDLLDVLYDTNE